jgi:hypothetical protein
MSHTEHVHGKFTDQNGTVTMGMSQFEKGWPVRR